MDHHDDKNFQLIHGKSLIKLGDTVVDVGACEGLYTNFFNQLLGATGSIYCIELMPQMFSYLEMRFGHMENVHFINAAVSDKNGTETIYACEDNEMHNILGQAGVKVGDINSITLDELLKNEEEVSFIKIDVEGAELKVLHGMKDVIKRTKTILIENHFDEHWPEIRKILIEDNGFSCYNIEKDENVTINSERPYQCLCRRES
jgi:FkbM family methyltransferase|tara:strand:- start:262 stop:870 length:609 start_codon:yes stop_codon:yes gene_type:complete